MALGYFQQNRNEILEFIPKGCQKVLEVGCGEGVFLQSLKRSEKTLETWGLELNPQAAKVASQHLDHVFTGDATKLVSKLPENYFDCIIMNDVLEHLADPEAFLLELKSKVLAKNGRIVCSIPNVRYIKNLFEFLFFKDWKYRDTGILDRTHLRFFTQKSILRMFHGLGFHMVAMKGINPCRKIFMPFVVFLSLGFLADTRYLQYACVVEEKK